MMFKTVLFGGFLFATLCAAADKPRMASLEVLPNLDQGLTYKDFRVHYSGAGPAFSSSTVLIKIYQKDQSNALITYEVAAAQVNTPNAYYFGDKDAKDGEYEVDVCAGAECSGRSPALTHMKNQTKGAVTCVKGKETGTGSDKTWSVTSTFNIDVIGADKLIEAEQMKKIVQGSKFPFEWKKYGIEANPSYKKVKEGHVLYAVVNFDIAHYRDLFLSKEALENTNDDDSYTHAFCERKYLLSGHVHLIKKGTHEVKYRFKKTLYLTEAGKKTFIIENTSDVSTRKRVPVELAFTEATIDAGMYDVWISFCATEKDKNDSTVCSEPLISESLQIDQE